MAEQRSKSKSLQVSAVMVTAKTENNRIVYLYRGDVVPEGLDKDSLEHLKSLGFVTEDDVAPVDAV
jgi:hypothetical protein